MWRYRSRFSDGRRLLISWLLMLATAPAAFAGSVGMDSLEEAKEQAVASGEPILVEVGAKWCGNCRIFERAVQSDAEVQAALEGVVLVAVDIEVGEGVEIQKTYHTKIYPTFLLLDAQGQVLDRDFGFLDPGRWVDWLEDARSDLRTVEEKYKVVESARTPVLARSLARDSFLSGRPHDAIDYYRLSQELDPESAPRVCYRIFYTMQDAMPLFSKEELVAAADEVLSNPNHDAFEILTVASAMQALAEREGDPELMDPYVFRALEETLKDDDPLVQKLRERLVTSLVGKDPFGSEGS